MAERPAALVTGGAHRLGRAIVLALAGAGYDVAIHCHGSRRAADALAASLRRRRSRAVVVEADLSDPAQAAGLFRAARRALGRQPRTIINNAADYPEGSAADMGPTRVARLRQLNLDSPVALAQALRRMARGSVVNVLDARMFDDDLRHAAYLETKRQLAAATKRLAIELAPKVRVNAVAPGAVLPPGNRAWSPAVVDATALRRTPTADDVAQAVVFLAQAESVTGQILYVDGGRHLLRAPRQA